MENFLRKSFYKNNDLLIIESNFRDLVVSALEVHDVADDELIKGLEKLVIVSSSLISGDQKLSLILKNYKKYYKIIATINGKLNFQISVDTTEANGEFSGYIIHETNGENFQGMLNLKDDLSSVIEDYLASSEQVNWFFHEDKLLVPNPEVTKEDALVDYDNVVAEKEPRNSYFDYQVKNICNCSKEKYIAKISRLEENELNFIFDETNEAEVTCEWCRTTYIISKDELTSV